MEANDIFTKYVLSFFSVFNCVFSGGLIFGAAIIMNNSQNYIPKLIEEVFSSEALAKTEYGEQRKRYFSILRSITFSTNFLLVGAAIYYIADFGISRLGNYFMIAFASAQYAAGVYVGRKMFYLAQMLNSIVVVEFEDDIFQDDRLAGIGTYVNALSTVTIFFTYMHSISYFGGAFAANPLFPATKILILLMAVIAAPVITIFNFYPRVVLQKLYSRCILMQLEKLKAKTARTNMTAFERMSYAIEYDKLCREELRNRMRVALSDLPVAITIIMMVIQVVMK
ncbi:MAG: hypothetical protein H7Z12_00530 [Rhodospirillaceae bacterium]|nr:hypothetical protein [Rhodospirillales bacterium]